MSRPSARKSRELMRAAAGVVGGKPTRDVPGRVYQLARGLTRSEAWRMARRLDPSRDHDAFHYDKRSGIARSLPKGAAPRDNEKTQPLPTTPAPAPPAIEPPPHRIDPTPPTELDPDAGDDAGNPGDF